MLFEQQVLTVQQVTRIIRERLTSDPRLVGVAVRGEISNFKHHGSGHMYFTLKDAHSRLRCVMFRSDNMRLRFRPEDGMTVIAQGDISVYEAAGDYQLYVRALVPAGQGELALAFEQLKQKLAAQGLFDPARKRPLPLLPRRVGVVTSLHGAALRDILSVIRRRFPEMPVLIAPAIVQGDEGPESVVRAIELINRCPDVDVLIVGRGGGSLEELWTFNDERVAWAIARSRIPVISAVGHETDFTIADFVADKRAPTPSAAAEMAVPEAHVLRHTIGSFLVRLEAGVRRRLEAGRVRLDLLSRRPALSRPWDLIAQRRQRVDDVLLAAARAVQQRIAAHERQLAFLAGKLDALSPLATLARGFAICRRQDTGEVVRSGRQVQPGTPLTIRVQDAEVWGRVEQVVPAVATAGEGLKP
ncbi:MAG: exodeoxyribonuclease VII large subunit [Firmicutes bacterium ZCTH02-B6]|nr:MAG: exodeoxyribonuclease VII large subunit [Firmicutes bacterium ZCTH02-B6]